jgi:bifunctional UDP-N-acetylglucosamine pyrophosphorylase/glucosamine-1-phosphate N-acetyltransferase
MAVALIILGAGKGTRMQSNLPKVIHEIGGAPNVGARDKGWRRT